MWTDYSALRDSRGLRGSRSDFKVEAHLKKERYTLIIISHEKLGITNDNGTSISLFLEPEKSDLNMHEQLLCYLLQCA